MPLLKRLKWKLRFGVASLMSPFSDELVRSIRDTRYKEIYNFRELAFQMNAHRKVLSDIVTRLDSPSEAYVKGIKPL